MLQRLVVGVDGFDGGRDAATFAGTLGAREIVLLGAYPQHVLQPAGSGDAVRQGVVRSLAAARAEAGIEADLEAVAGTSPAQALHAAAERHRADLLVVGCAHRGAAGRAVLGDVSRAALHHAPCAVAVVPHRYRPRGLRRATVGVAFDGSPESRVALGLATALAERLDARLDVLTACEGMPLVVAAAAYQRDAQQMGAEDRTAAADLLRDAVDELPPFAAGRLLDGPAGHALCAASEELDVLVVGSRGRGPVRRVTLGSTSDAVVHGAGCPVIVVARGDEPNLPSGS